MALALDERAIGLLVPTPRGREQIPLCRHGGGVECHRDRVCARAMSSRPGRSLNVNVALPAIQDDLGFSSSGLAWVVNAYLIAFGGLLLLAGRLGDLVSRRGVFLAGLGV